MDRHALAVVGDDGEHVRAAAGMRVAEQRLDEAEREGREADRLERRGHKLQRGLAMRRADSPTTETRGQRRRARARSSSRRAIPRRATPESFAAPQSFVVPPHLLGIFGRHGIAVDRHLGIGRFVPANFVVDLPAQFVERLGQRNLQLLPIGLGGMLLELRSSFGGAIANASSGAAQLGIVEHFFDVAQALGPLAEIAAGDGTARTAPPSFRPKVALEQLIQVAVAVGAIVAAAKRRALAI